MHADRDTDLHRRLLAGDECALAEAYDAYAPSVYGVARWMLDDAADAEDILQDVFVRLWQRPEEYQPARGPLRAWLCAVARHRAIDHLRRATTANRCLRRIVDTAAFTADAADSVIDDEVGKAVRAAVCALPESHRTVVLLAYYGGLSYRQVASTLGIPEGTAKSRLRAALRLLAMQLGPDLRD
jgi:RNA polymerase sigma-70 factor (ECF subfamily)